MDTLYLLQMCDCFLVTALVREQHSQLGMNHSNQSFIRSQLECGFVLLDCIGNASGNLRKRTRQAKVSLREVSISTDGCFKIADCCHVIADCHLTTAKVIARAGVFGLEVKGGLKMRNPGRTIPASRHNRTDPVMRFDAVWLQTQCGLVLLDRIRSTVGNLRKNRS